MAEIEIRELEWGAWNEAHILEKHALTRAEVEDMCYGDPDQLKAEAVHNERLRDIGPKSDGKLIEVILASQGEGRY